MPKAITSRPKLTKLVRDLECPYSTVSRTLSTILHSNEGTQEDIGVNQTTKSYTNQGRNSCSSSTSKLTKPTATSLAYKLRQLMQEDEEQEIQTRNGDSTSIEHEKLLSRGQRRRQAKKERLQRKFNFVKYTNELLEIEKKKKEYGNALTDFTAMSNALQETSLMEVKRESDVGCPMVCCNHLFHLVCSCCFGTVISNPLKPKSVHAKAKQMQKELEEYQRILEFPKYQENPFGVIAKHLENSIRLQQKTRHN